MATKRLLKYSLLSTVGIGSFLAGSYYEKNNNSIVCKPCLPIFGTVSAAVPFTTSPQTTSSNASRISQIMKYGFPGMDHVRSFDDFVLSYDRKTRVAHWVFEHLTAENTKKNDGVDRALCDFKPDESIHSYFRSENSDYKRSGYDRGHLAAAGNHKGHQKHCDQTFYLSNMAPQVGVGFNRDSWNRLERYVRKLTNTYPNVYCCTGPLYLPKKEGDGKKYVRYEVIGEKNVAVPTHFFKVLVMETSDGHLEMESFVMPNQVIDNEVPLTSFQVPPESIERAAGLLFFDNVSRSKISKINGKKQ
ncbi:PREDICTED: endonuclease G, mitochondrial [Nicrophorus vespilloides]|uniref:Endonuclease n=1 Tax=Nicrophorus vespilloides TaxID=110193 RepID=A0ABM1MCD9_NICVS|nr:PREDICTED: endonuclease G, mitochondrial [Nicrophorus vespilloides]